MSEDSIGQILCDFFLKTKRSRNVQNCNSLAGVWRGRPAEGADQLKGHRIRRETHKRDDGNDRRHGNWQNAVSPQS